MAKSKQPKAGKAPKGGQKPEGPEVKGALLGRATNLVAVLFGLSLAVQEVVARVAAAA